MAKQIRRHALRMANSGGGSHIGSVLSIADILAVLYGTVLRVDCKNPDWCDRDRFILSKGHAGAGVYAALAESGFFPKEKLDEHYTDGSLFSGHVSHKGIPGVEFSTGSLGHGLSVGAGMALAAKLAKCRHRVFLLLGDGECDEGSNWEAIMFSAHHKLDNLVAIVDYNKLQSIKAVAETLELEPFADKWKSFGWEVSEEDGHDCQALFESLASVPFNEGRPSCLIAHTTKGKGVSFMENHNLWHYRSPDSSELKAALKELGDNA